MASSLLPLLCFSLLLSAASASGHRHGRSPKADAVPDAASAAIRQACRASFYPELCESNLSHLSKPLPANASAADIILAVLGSASHGLRIAQANAQAILDASASNLNRSNAARNCLEYLSLSGHRLAAASSALPAGKLPDARLFAGAAELYQYDCWSSLKYVNGTQQVADAMSFVYGLANLTGSAAAMVAALQRYGADTSGWAPPQTERDGYWPDARNEAADGSAVASCATGYAEAEPEPDAKVCKGGGCEFETVQAAVEAAPENYSGERRYVIYVKEGVYEETVRVPFEKTNLAVVGEGIGKTVITGSLNADTPGVSTYNTATVGVSGDGFMARDLTIENTAGPDKHQAVAFRSDSDLSILQSVEFLGHQDTLYAHSLRQFYNACLIAGTVDFIFGNSAAVIRDCLIVVLPRQVNPEKGETNTVTAHGRTDPAQPTGFVFDRCAVNGSEEYLRLYRSKPAVHRLYLGRPWKEYSRTVFIDCYLSEIVRPEGWSPWIGDFALKTLYYGEFGNSGPGANSSARVPWSNKIPSEHLDVYSLENFIQGDQWIKEAL